MYVFSYVCYVPINGALPKAQITKYIYMKQCTHIMYLGLPKAYMQNIYSCYCVFITGFYQKAQILLVLQLYELFSTTYLAYQSAHFVYSFHQVQFSFERISSIQQLFQKISRKQDELYLILDFTFKFEC